MEEFGEQVRYAVFYVYNFVFATTYINPSDLLGHFWSLSVEEQFYVFWPLLIFFTPEKFQKRLFLAFIFLGGIFRIMFFFIHASGEFRFFLPEVSEAIFPLPLTHLDAFAFGAYISRYSIPKPKIQFYFLLMVLPLIGFATQYFATGQFGALYAFGYPILMPAGYQFIWGYTILNYFFALTILLVARYAMFNRFLEWQPMRYLGKTSYGLYVFHQPAIWFVTIRFRDFGMDPGTVKPIIALVSFSITLLAAALSYHLMEKPLLNLKDRFFPTTT